MNAVVLPPGAADERAEPARALVLAAGRVFLPEAPASPRRKLAAAISLALHAGLAVYLWNWSHEPAPPAAPERVIEMVIAPPEPPKLIEPPKPIEPPKVKTIEPPRAAPPKPAPAPAVAPSVVPSPAPVAATPAPPEPAPAPAPVAAPASPAPPAPAAAHPGPPNSPDAIPTDYANQVFARINRIASGRYPKAAMLRRQEGRIGYRLTLAPDGTLLGYELDKCGIEALDNAAEDALKAAAPFPKLPDLGAASYRLAGAIVYRLGN
ncbi:TonB family protein [Derxia lacustris]|uniref:TonB family protein n=1 Tax=Derxia lacustris TaxID=764842 RepID=UPI000A17236D|nr:TonB family protein [Derxia lacustris]